MIDWAHIETATEAMRDGRSLLLWSAPIHEGLHAQAVLGSWRETGARAGTWITAGNEMSLRPTHFSEINVPG